VKDITDNIIIDIDKINNKEEEKELTAQFSENGKRINKKLKSMISSFNWKFIEENEKESIKSFEKRTRQKRTTSDAWSSKHH